MISGNAIDLLNKVEKLEMRSLGWGFVDGVIKENEILSLFENIVDHNEIDDLIEELIENKQLFEINRSAENRTFRSRFAELVRLLSYNRQLLPRKSWSSSASLVSDYRLNWSPRKFPNRDRNVNDILSDNPILNSNDLRTSIWKKLTAEQKINELAGFQERSIVRLLNSSGDTGTIVTSGTGSGKTLAFYLPALIKVAENITHENWTKVLVIYPRKELLKDQFSEVYKIVRNLSKFLNTRNKRKILLGTYYGSTPNISREKSISYEWDKKGRNYICPWVRCPQCDEEMIWKIDDIEQKNEKLFCSNFKCNTSINEDEIILTRNRAQNTFPDILFTTVETLNRRMSDTWSQKIFGVKQENNKKPFYALLDEVHTYEGSTGAHTALVFKRWRYLLKKPISWVGLSATLDEAESFFASLIGLDEENVKEITVNEDEFSEEGAEYQIALQSNPSSNLLSTTIQTSMLLPRFLNLTDNFQSPEINGKKVFVFTNELDVNNRLYNDLLNAEAYNRFRNPDNNLPILASLRGDGNDSATRALFGQRWDKCEQIGHDLNHRLRIGRTSAQDSGVNKNASLIVATSSLEVGFNDTEVGGVIQHKAPMLMSSFLQRKGRAGRDRKTRPITLTVLSDYGRDRTFFQSFEYLFNPTIQAVELPIKNPYILKTQCIYSFFDWVATKISGKGEVWNLVSASQKEDEKKQPVIEEIKSILSQIIQGDSSTINELSNFIKKSLDIDGKTLNSLLWEEPRPLLLGVIPTLVRRIFTNWDLAFPKTDQDKDIQKKYHPLPDFMPSSLFEELGLSEVNLIIPQATVNLEEKEESMPILQALNQYAPGRISLRYAYEIGDIFHWYPIEKKSGNQNIIITDYLNKSEHIGTFKNSINTEVQGQEINVYRPWEIKLSKNTDRDILKSSNAFLRWNTNISENGDPLSIPFKVVNNWPNYIEKIDFFLHRFSSSVKIQRFAHSVEANTKTRSSDINSLINFETEDGKPAGVGFELEVDGVKVDFKVPDNLEVLIQEFPKDVLRNSKTNYIKDLIIKDKNLPIEFNFFQREYLIRLIICGFLVKAETKETSLENIIKSILLEDNLKFVLEDLITNFYKENIDIDLIEEENNSETEIEQEDKEIISEALSRIKTGLLGHIENEQVLNFLKEILLELIKPNDLNFQKWLKNLIINSMGQAILQSCISASPKYVSSENLLVDIDIISDSNTSSIWITEQTLGGSGVLESFANKFSLDPQIFSNALEGILVPFETELTDISLRSIIKLLNKDERFKNDFNNLRSISSHIDRNKEWQKISQQLIKKTGIYLGQSLSISVNTRLLRPGSNSELDKLLYKLIDRWESLETKYDLVLNLREFSSVIIKDKILIGEIRGFLSYIINENDISDELIRSNIENLLWLSSKEICNKSLQSYNPYRKNISIDQLVLRTIFKNSEIPEVDYEDIDFKLKLKNILETNGNLKIKCKVSKRKILREELINIISTPLEIGSLQLYPMIDSFSMDEQYFSTIISLRETI